MWYNIWAMESNEWLKLLKENGPLIGQWLISLGLGATGGLGAAKLAVKRQRRVMANLRRPIIVIGTPGQDLKDQHRLLKKVDLFEVSDHADGEKASDYLTTEHRLMVLGYSATAEYKKAFEKARSCRLPVLIYAKPGAVSKEDLDEISGYSFASLCNTDLRLVSDVFALMSTFPEK